MISLLFKLMGDASPLRRTLTGLRTDARAAGKAAGKELAAGMTSGSGTGGAGGGLRRALMAGLPSFGIAGSAGSRLLGAGGAAGLGGATIAGGVIAAGMAGRATLNASRTASEEALRIQNLASQTGLTTEEIQRAELAKKLYGSQVRRSTEALQAAMATIKDNEISSAAAIESMANQQREWTRTMQALHVAMDPVYRFVNETLREFATRVIMWTGVTKGVATKLGVESSPSSAAAAMATGGGATSPGKAGAFAKYLGITKENRAGFPTPTSDALQRIGLFVGGSPIGSQTLKIQQAQLRELSQIRQGINRINLEGI